MAYKFNPFIGKLDNTGPEVTALNTLGVKADLATIQAIVGPSVGDVWQADDTDIFYLWDGSSWVSLGTLGTPGPTGATGATGADGTDGSTILSGSGAPVDNVTGSDGDFYIDTAAHTIYGPRTAGAWGVGTSLVAGGATTLGGLTDVDLTTSPPTNGEALVYDSVNSEWVPGSAGATAAGSANQIQYNDGAGGLAASADLTWDNTAKELGVTGDLNLDDGVGGNTTTIQAVTPTQDRTISFPDATGTVALVNGANGTIQYNDAGTNAGDSGLLYDATSGSLSVGGKTVTTDAPVINLSQTWNNAATTFTGLKLNVTDTASLADSNLLDLQVGGSVKARINTDGTILSPDVTNRTAISPYNAYGYGVDGSTNVIFAPVSQPTLKLKTTLTSSTDNLTLDCRSGGSIGFGDALPDLLILREAAGVLKVTDGSTGTGYIKQVPVLTANLPNAATVGAGTRGFVSDAGTIAFNTDIGTGTGTPSANTTIPVFSDGSVWKAG